MTDRGVSLSVLVPVYNEEHLVFEALNRLRVLESCEFLSSIEIIVVDDGSTDGTPQILGEFARAEASPPVAQADRFRWLFRRHPRNLGKGAAIKTALELASAEVSIIHDADLEYDPRDLLTMLRVMAEQSADAVYGSRFAGGAARRVLLFNHQLGNRILTLACNLITNLNLTDVWTGSKAIRTELLKSIPIRAEDFKFEQELTIKLAKRQATIFEVPISYFGRTYDEGKKIGWRDGLAALWNIIRCAFDDDIYQADIYGSRILARLSRAQRYNRWMADTIRPYCGQRILEIGSGVGNLSRLLIPRRRYLASDINPLYLRTLENLSGNRPYMRAAFCDVTDAASFAQLEEKYDTVVCLNVIEHVADDRGALDNIRSVLAPGGRAIILVPHGPWNMGTLDQVLGHHRRYTRKSLESVAAASGFVVVRMLRFNRFGSAAWFLNGRMLRRRSFGLGQIWMLNAITPLLRRIDRVLPLPALSLIAILDRAPV